MSDQPLHEFAAEQDAARFEENQRILNECRTLRRALKDRAKEMDAVRARLSEYEHPSSVVVETALARQASLTTESVAALLDVGTDEAQRVMADMAARGYNVVDGVISTTASGRRVEVEHFYGDVVRFGIVSDTHLGNLHAMEDELHEAYAVFAREGIESVYVPGNMVDGEKTYAGQEYEIKVMGVDNVVSYLARTWPRIPGITTYHVASSTCHEGYYLKSAGVLIGKLFEAERPDLVYLGLDEADIVLHDSEARPTLRIVHPGGGSSYADSYRPQKIMESYGAGEKPTALAIGHYHKSGFYDIRDAPVLQAGCLERQTPFMRKRSLRAVMGFWIVEMSFSEHGSLRRMRPEWYKYYVGSGGKILRDWEV